MSRLHFQPVKNQARKILKAILQTPEVTSCRMKETLAIRLACEEIVMNITSYAYPEDEDGYLDIEIRKTDRLTICFTDGGKPFNPFQQKKPDTTQSWRLRRIGGLGIFLVTRKMDKVHYTYENKKNILIIEKNI